MPEKDASIESGATAEIESQNARSVQTNSVFDDEQFTVDGLHTLFQYMLQQVKDLVTQLRDEKAHDFYTAYVKKAWLCTSSLGIQSRGQPLGQEPLRGRTSHERDSAFLSSWRSDPGTRTYADAS